MTKKHDMDSELSSALSSALLLAARVVDVKVMRQLLAVGANPDSSSEFGRTALSFAIAGDRSAQAVRALLEAGASANLASHGIGGRGESAPLVSALNVANPNLEVVKLLLAAGADPNAEDGRRLARAVEAQDIEIVRALVEAGADINKWAQLLDSALPLERAARCGRAEVAQLLLGAGAIIPASLLDEAFWASRGGEDNAVRKIIYAEAMRRNIEQVMAHDATAAPRPSAGPSPL